MARSHKDDDRSAATSGGSKRQRLKNKLKFWSHSDGEGSDRDVPEPEGSAGSDASASRRDSGTSSRRRSRESGARRRTTQRGGHDDDDSEEDDTGGDGPAPEPRSRRRRIKDKLKSAIPFVGHSTTTSTSSSSYVAEQAAKAKKAKAKEDDVPDPDDGGGAAGPSGTGGGGVTFEDDDGSPREDYYGGRPGAAAAAAVGGGGGAAVPSAFGSGGDPDFGLGPPPPSDDAYLGGRTTGGGGGGSGIGAYADGPLRTSGEPGWDPAVSPAAVATALSAAAAVTRAFEAGSPGWPYDDLSLQQLFQKIGEGVIASALAATKMADDRGGGGGGGGGSGSGVDRVAGRPPPLSPSYRLGGGAGMGGRPSGSSGGGGAYVSRSVASGGPPPRAGSMRSTISSSSGGSRRGHRARVPNVGSGGKWRPTGTRKALLIGIRYDGKAHLPGTLNDVAMLVSTLSTVASFHRKNMVILSDGKPDVGHGSRAGPATRASILAEMRKLVDGASAGDSLFVHFSGHGSQVADVSASGGATETDGMDETLVPSDWKTAGMVVDDEVYRTLIEPLPAGVRLTACFDACNSGTAADLPYTFRAGPSSDAGGSGAAGGGPTYVAEKVDALVEARTGRPLRAAKADKRTTHGTGGAGGPGPAGEAIVFSACADGETAAGTTVLSSDGTPAGAMTTAWVKAMRAGGRGAWKDLTYTQLLGRMSRTVRQAAPAQEARVSVSMPDFHPDCRVRL